MKEKIYFYYTNDLHSHFNYWPQIVRFLKDAKAAKKADNESCWIVDIGDHIDRVHPIAEAFMGKANVQLLNEAGYHFATIGNNEGITMDHRDLYHLYDDASFEVVCANLHNMKGAKPDWLQATASVTSTHGVNIGIIGLTAPFNAYYELLDWHASPPYQALENHIGPLKKESDIIILLSHLGINEDQEIARLFPDIDVIIGGHTHHLLRRGEYVNQTVITAAGKHGSHVGEVILTWDHARNKLIHKEAYTTNITHLKKDAQTERTLYKLRERADKRLDQPFIYSKTPLSVKWFASTPLMQAFTDTLKEWTKADCAMLNAGLLMESFSAGNITYGDIHRICPHPINPCVVTLNGDELLEVIRVSLTKEFMQQQLKGFGFRGEVIGRMVFSGLKIETKQHPDGSEYVIQAYLADKPVLSENIYRVATADTFTFGRLLPEIAKAKSKTYFLPEFLRDILAHTLKHKFANPSQS